MDFHCRVIFTCVRAYARTRVNELEAMNERSCVNINRMSLNFDVYTRPFLHYLYFNDARKIYVLTQVKTTREWKSTSTLSFFIQI